MLTSKKSFAVMSLVLLVIALGLLFGCGDDDKEEPTSTPHHTPTETPTEEPIVTPSQTPTETPLEPTPKPPQFPSIEKTHDLSRQCETIQNKARSLLDVDPDNDYREYVRGQVIITGDPGVITPTIAQLGFDPSAMNPLSLRLGADVIVRYETSAIGVPALEFVEEFNLAVDPNAAIAEPNYVIREPGGPGTHGSPGDSGIMGDPATFPASITTATADDFINQWAFSGATSIELERIFDYGSNEYYEAGASLENPVKILVFDSSPLTTGSHLVSLGQKYPPYSLCVSALISEAFGMPSESQEIDSHGLFVANLAHAVAPDSFIHLVQVLQYIPEQEGGGIIRGNLFSLLNTLHIYLEDDTSRMTVVNLSLGFDIDAQDLSDGTTSPELGSAIESVRIGLRDRGDFVLQEIEDEMGTESNEYTPVVSLQTLLHRYYERGVIFVAASGNDHKDLPQTPAIYPWVIGVAASNQEGNVSCFSNGGDVSAPGGSQSGGGCAIGLENVCNNNNCPYGVMSVIMTDTTSASYAYWLGTSFSTPLVSGMAALALANEHTMEEVQDFICPYQDRVDAVSRYLYQHDVPICGPATLSNVTP